MALRERMGSREPGSEPVRAPESSWEKSCHPHCTNTTTSLTTPSTSKPTCTTPTTTSTTTQDILSVKNCVARSLLPPLAKKLAAAASLTALVLEPYKNVFAAVENRLDLMEVACSPTSTLTSTFEDAGLRCLRVNYQTGFDLDTRKGTSILADDIKKQAPRVTWISLKCTRLSSLQNLTERDELAWSRFLKRRGQDLRRA